MQTVNEAHCAILFVDDEEMARKYFDRAFSREFRIFTAAGVAPARELLERHGDKIGILISDQRMPEEKGVVLLRYAREHYPHIVRILTTAYSDLDDAIESVNSGEILRYITKPWDLKLLGSELRHAMRFFDLQQQRDQLMQEKLSVQQRLIEVNWARDLIVMAGSFSQVSNPLQAIRSFLLQMPVKEPAPENTMDRWQLLEEQLDRILETSRKIIELTHNQGMAFERVDIAKFWGEMDTPPFRAVEVKAIFAGNLPQVRVQSALIRELLRLLIQEQTHLIKDVDGAVVEMSVSPIHDTGEGGGGVKILFRNFCFRQADVSSLSSSTGLLSAFFIAYHHGGSLAVREQDGVSFELSLPLDASEVDLPPPGAFWMDEVFARYE